MDVPEASPATTGTATAWYGFAPRKSMMKFMVFEVQGFGQWIVWIIRGSSDPGPRWLFPNQLHRIIPWSILVLFHKLHHIIFQSEGFKLSPASFGKNALPPSVDVLV